LTPADELAREDPHDQRNRVHDEPDPICSSRYVVIRGRSVHLPLDHHDDQRQNQQRPARNRKGQNEQHGHDQSEQSNPHAPKCRAAKKGWLVAALERRFLVPQRQVTLAGRDTPVSSTIGGGQSRKALIER
jgi:hypothetical protein